MTDRRPPDVVTCGEPLVALLTRDSLPIEAGATFRATVTGAELNTAVGLARLGHAASYAGRVGDDGLGRLVASRVLGERVDAHLAVDAGRPTGMLVRTGTTAHEAEVVYGRTGSAGGRLAPDDLPWRVWHGAAYGLVTGLTAVLSESAAEAVSELAGRLSSWGGQLVVDPNVRLKLADPEATARRIEPATRAAGIVVSGVSELGVLVPGIDDVDKAVAALLHRGCGLVVVKDGARGTWADDGRHRWVQPALPACVVDAVGAGDAFTAGLLSALLDGLPVPDALRRAAWVAARAIEVSGDAEGLPRRSRLASPDIDTEVSR